MKKYIGDRDFYRSVFRLIIPMMIQMAITSFVTLLDNVMVGGLGTEAISAVAIVNQIIMVFDLTIFGGIGGASIFGAQFFGNGDNEGVRNTFRFRMIFCIAISAAATLLFFIFGGDFIRLFLKGDSNGGDMELAYREGVTYFRIVLAGLIPFAVVQAYASTLKDSGETVAPMAASVIAIFVNLILNYLLIFGNFGFPRMGVAGAAVGTLVARYVEMIYVMQHAHRHIYRYPFMDRAYSSLRIPGDLVKRILKTGLPLLVNETFWSLGMTFIMHSYSTRGLSAVAAVNITNTVWNILAIMCMASGGAIGIMVGQKLGSGDREGAKDTDRKLIFFTMVLNTAIGIIFALCSGFIPMLYNISDEVRDITTKLLIIAGLTLPIQAYLNAAYNTIRSGGRTFITFLFDCLYTWVVPVPLAYCLCSFTDLPIVWLFLIINVSDALKAIIGGIMLKSDFWAKNIISAD